MRIKFKQYSNKGVRILSQLANQMNWQQYRFCKKKSIFIKRNCQKLSFDAEEEIIIQRTICYYQKQIYFFYGWSI
jgi:hypothetical protein